jgi:hypothetical protein
VNPRTGEVFWNYDVEPWTPDGQAAQMINLLSNNHAMDGISFAVTHVEFNQEIGRFQYHVALTPDNSDTHTTFMSQRGSTGGELYNQISELTVNMINNIPRQDNTSHILNIFWMADGEEPLLLAQDRHLFTIR